MANESSFSHSERARSGSPICASAVTSQNDYVPIDSGDLTTKWLVNGLPDGRYELPGSVVAFSDPADDPKIRVTVFAERPGPDGKAQQFVRRRAVMRLIKEKTVFLRLGLTLKCVDSADCLDSETCIEGRCRSPEVDSSQPAATVCSTNTTACVPRSMFAKNTARATRDGSSARARCACSKYRNVAAVAMHRM